MTETAQYVLDFPVLHSHSREDFVVGGCNRLAADYIRKWPDWPGHALVLAGAPGSGKTHLASIWAERAGARQISGRALTLEQVPDLGPRVLLEAADLVADEAALLHLYNWTGGKGGALLLTARSAPAQWPIALDDLASRLKSAPLVTLGHPDELILGAAMAKQFSDRQMLVDDAVISYLLKRMERSFSAVRSIVDKVDSLSLREKTRVTIPLARKVLEGR